MTSPLPRGRNRTYRFEFTMHGDLDSLRKVALHATQQIKVEFEADAVDHAQIKVTMTHESGMGAEQAAVEFSRFLGNNLPTS